LKIKTKAAIALPTVKATGAETGRLHSGDRAAVPQSADKKIIYVSQSALSRFLECKKKAKLVMEGWIPKKSSRALRYGSLFHAALEAATVAFNQTGKPPTFEAICKGVATYIKQWEEENPDLMKIKAVKEEMLYDIELVKVQMKHYVQHYVSDFDGSKKWVALEHKFEIPYNGIMLFGYIDSMYEEKKDIYILESKTRGRVSDDIVDLLHTDFQTFYYLHGVLLATGRFPKKLVYNIAVKFGGKVKIGETPAMFAARFETELKDEPSKYFRRIPTLITKEEYAAWVKNTLDPMLQDYKAWREGNAPSYCNTTNCEGKYGSCDYLPICALNDFSGYKKKSREEAKAAAQRVTKK